MQILVLHDEKSEGKEENGKYKKRPFFHKQSRPQDDFIATKKKAVITTVVPRGSFLFTVVFSPKISHPATLLQMMPRIDRGKAWWDALLEARHVAR